MARKFREQSQSMASPRDEDASEKRSARNKNLLSRGGRHLQPFSSHTTARIVDAMGKRKNQLTFENAGTKQSVSFGRTEMLSTLLKDLCDIDFFRSIIDKAASPHKIESVEINPHVERGGKLYTRFLGALEKKMNENPGLLGEIVDFLLKRQKEHSIQVDSYKF